LHLVVAAGDALLLGQLVCASARWFVHLPCCVSLLLLELAVCLLWLDLVQFPLLDVLTAPSHLRASMIARGEPPRVGRAACSLGMARLALRWGREAGFLLMAVLSAT
jgi:hypothetical protein